MSINKPEDFNHIRAHNYSILLHETYAGLQETKKSFLLKGANGPLYRTSVGRGVSATSLRPPVGHRIDPQETSLVLGAEWENKTKAAEAVVVMREKTCNIGGCGVQAVASTHRCVGATRDDRMRVRILRYVTRPRTDPMKCDRAHGLSITQCPRILVFEIGCTKRPSGLDM